MQQKEIIARLNETGRLLVKELGDGDHWKGELSSSALGTAVSLAALYFDDRKKHSAEIKKGLAWLSENINDDGSFGDTPGSPGNVSTTLLVFAALNLQSGEPDLTEAVRIKARQYLNIQGIDPDSPDVAESILNHYGNDYTFSVPILTMCGLCGIPRENAFDNIPQLPFELLLLPGRLYRLLNLNVVSYALPALAAVGIAIHKKKKSGWLWRIIRHFSVSRALKKLQQMLPESGGYLEAVPLTAFVCLSLINAGYRHTEIVSRGIGFLKRTHREDGSWPIDVDLSTWVTSLSVKAFRSNLDLFLTPDKKTRISKHFKAIQNKAVHPFNRTSPGGWGWTKYTGSVPDGDDTPGAILALFMLEPENIVKSEVLAGGWWLHRLQNKDGGFPTFSKGWGKLPFDQSCPDLTGHCLLAFSAIIENYGNELTKTDNVRFSGSFTKALRYLEKEQYNNGSWLPLWFGNQLTKDHTNPVYGTARVAAYLCDTLQHNWYSDEIRFRIRQIIKKSTAFLVSLQNEDGSWGGDRSVPGSIEETSLAVSVLASSEHRDLCYRALEWIEEFRYRQGFATAPIGLYFASLWYEEKLYPATFYLEALSRMAERY